MRPTHSCVAIEQVGRDFSRKNGAKPSHNGIEGRGIGRLGPATRKDRANSRSAARAPSASFKRFHSAGHGGMSRECCVSGTSGSALMRRRANSSTARCIRPPSIPAASMPSCGDRSHRSAARCGDRADASRALRRTMSSSFEPPTPSGVGRPRWRCLPLHLSRGRPPPAEAQPHRRAARPAQFRHRRRRSAEEPGSGLLVGADGACRAGSRARRRALRLRLVPSAGASCRAPIISAAIPISTMPPSAPRRRRGGPEQVADPRRRLSSRQRHAGHLLRRAPTSPTLRSTPTRRPIIPSYWGHADETGAGEGEGASSTCRCRAAPTGRLRARADPGARLDRRQSRSC